MRVGVEPAAARARLSMPFLRETLAHRCSFTLVGFCNEIVFWGRRSDASGSSLVATTRRKLTACHEKTARSSPPRASNSQHAMRIFFSFVPFPFGQIQFARSPRKQQRIEPMRPLATPGLIFATTWRKLTACHEKRQTYKHGCSRLRAPST